MKRFLSIAVVGALLSAWVGAQGPARPSPEQQARLVERNRVLYRVAVDGGLNLTDQDKQNDPLHRAACCTQLVRQWAKEIEKAAFVRDGERVTELGQHLGQVVDRGVVPNLEQARKDIKAGSELEKALFKQRDDALDILKPLEESLRHTQGFDAIVRTLTEGRDKVEKAAKSESK